MFVLCLKLLSSYLVKIYLINPETVLKFKSIYFIKSLKKDKGNNMEVKFQNNNNDDNELRHHTQICDFVGQ